MVQAKKKPSQLKRYGNAIQSVLIWVFTYLIVFSLIAAGITPKRVDLHVGSPSAVTILATKDVEDLVTTEKLRDDAEASVELSYKSVDQSVTASVLSAFDTAVASLNDLRSQYAGEEVTGESLREINNVFSMPKLTSNQVGTFLKSDDDTINALFTDTRQLLSDAMLSTVPEGSEQTVITRINRDLRQNGFDDVLVHLAAALVEDVIQPNMAVDTDTTEANRTAARNAVSTQICVKGEVIVREGEIVTQAEYAMVSSLGLIRSDGYDYLLFLGVALLVLILFAGIIAYMFIFEPQLLADKKTLLLIAVINILVVGLSLLMRQLSMYFMPVSLGVFLIVQLIKPRLALIVNISQAIMVSLLTMSGTSTFSTPMFTLVVSSVVSASIVVAIVRHSHTRRTLLLAGLMIALINLGATFAVGFISSTNTSTVAINALWSGASGLLSSVLCIGLQPLLEWMFNLVTTSKLMELSSPDQPLLKRLMIEAPGTYHHSIVVANLAESASAAIGANSALARVGAYYHDVGKLMRPLYFTENQYGDNPHDRTDPYVSSQILTAHTREGVTLAKKAHLPKPILDIIEQHHGTQPTMYFYAKAVKEAGAANVDVDEFRYAGPRPQTKEAAIVMMADSLEAMMRSKPNATREETEELIKKLIRGKLDDGQWEDCPLTTHDLAVCTETFLTSLSGAFHSRIAYPDVKVPEHRTGGEAAKPAQEAVKPDAEAPKPQQARPGAAEKPACVRPAVGTAAETPKPQPVKPGEAEKPASVKPAAESSAEMPKPQPAKTGETERPACAKPAAEQVTEAPKPQQAKPCETEKPGCAKPAAEPSAEAPNPQPEKPGEEERPVSAKPAAETVKSVEGGVQP